MKYQFILDIGYVQSHSGDEIAKVLNLKSNIEYIGAWSYEILDNDNIDFALEFTKILSGKLNELKSIGITKNDIRGWFIYDYEHQCNMEFTSRQLKLLGDNGIKLCISCYDVGAYEEEAEQ